VNWDITQPTNMDEALSILSEFRAAFSDFINKAQMHPVASQVMTVLSVPDSRGGGPVRRIAGVCDVDENTVVFKPFGFDERIPSELAEGGGSIQIDINCDYLQTRQGNPVSGSASPLIGLAGPYPPGGILRVSIVVGA